MGIFDALNTSVGGLQAQSFALQNISGNIANASTVGYKGIDTSFEDLIPDSTTPDKQVAGGVTAFAQATITTQGTVSSSTVATNMAINGDGFFSVQKPTSITDNVPVFDGVTEYTRRGDFQVNANGNLVNGAGYYLMGVAVELATVFGWVGRLAAYWIEVVACAGMKLFWNCSTCGTLPVGLPVLGSTVTPIR